MKSLKVLKVLDIANFIGNWRSLVFTLISCLVLKLPDLLNCFGKSSASLQSTDCPALVVRQEALGAASRAVSRMQGTIPPTKMVKIYKLQESCYVHLWLGTRTDSLGSLLQTTWCKLLDAASTLLNLCCRCKASEWTLKDHPECNLNPSACKCKIYPLPRWAEFPQRSCEANTFS